MQEDGGFSEYTFTDTRDKRSSLHAEDFSNNLPLVSVC